MDDIKKTLAAYRRAVRKHCLDCSGGELKTTDKCTVKQCALYELRPRLPQTGRTNNGKQKTQVRRAETAP